MPQNTTKGSRIGIVSGAWNEETTLGTTQRKLEVGADLALDVQEAKTGITSVAGGPGTGPVLVAGPISMATAGVFVAPAFSNLLPVNTPDPLPADGLLIGPQPYDLEFDVVGAATVAAIEVVLKDGYGEIFTVPLTLAAGVGQVLSGRTAKRILAIRVITPEAGITIENIRQGVEIGLKYPLGSVDGSAVVLEIVDGTAPGVAGTFANPLAGPDPRGTFIPDPAAVGPNDYDLVYLASQVETVS